MNRRTVLKAAGVTSTLPIVSGSATARGDDDDDDNGNDDGEGQGRETRECPRPNCIHPTLGYTGLAPDEPLPDPLRPDHEVDLMTRFPEAESERPLPEFFFEPTGLFVNQGDVVRFNLATPDHTVTAYHPGLGRQRRVPDDVPAFSSPVLAGGTFWLYRFDEPGVYDVLCAPHEIFGMVGRIVVEDPSADWLADDDTGDGDETEAADDTETAGEEMGGEPQLRPPELTAALVYQDPALEPETIEEMGAVRWAELADESKEILVQISEGAGEA